MKNIDIAASGRGLVKTLLFFTFLIAQHATATGNDADLKGKDFITDLSLSHAIEHYYRAEKYGDWKSTYAMRTPAFKEIVPFSSYSKGMNEGNEGWQLLQVEILAPEKYGGTGAQVKIRFVEKFDQKVAKEHFGNRVESGVARYVENTVWEKQNGRWYSVEPGKRGHLPLNDRLVDK